LNIVGNDQIGLGTSVHGYFSPRFHINDGIGINPNFFDKGSLFFIVDHLTGSIISHVGHVDAFTGKGKTKGFALGAMENVGRVGEIQIEISDVENLFVFNSRLFLLIENTDGVV
jgi:hypothetical protein